MEIVVRGKNRPVSRYLQTISREKLSRIARLTHDAGRIEVDFSEVRNPRESRPQECEVTVHLKRHFVKARAAAAEAETALDLVVDKIEHQVSRIKDRRVTRVHQRRGGTAASNGHVPQQSTEQDGDESVLDDEGQDPVATGPPIVKTKRFTSKPMTPDEAHLQMDLLGHEFFLFTNSDSGRVAVLYRRRDGALGLIEATS